MRNIKAIIFASNVISNSSKSYKLFAKEFNLDEKEVNTLNERYFLPAKRGRYSRTKLINLLSKELKVNRRKIEENSVECGKLFEVNSKILKVVNKLKEKYRLVIVSNTNELFASLKKEKELYDVFDLAILSYKIKSLRPKLKAYEEVLRKFNITGKECIYIDSKPNMLLPANNLGMKTILFKNEKQLSNKLKGLLK